jgi:ribosomal protein S18 acetylase RimI-like enzyme
VEEQFAMIRSTEEDDLPLILALASDFFTPSEVACIRELLEVYLYKPGQKDYVFLCYENGSRVVGFACYGPTPLTECTFYLYWICVDRDSRDHGVGSALLAEIGARIAQRGGGQLVAETSSTPQYAPARRFYTQHGFEQLARIPDFYAPGDHLVIYGKRCRGSMGDPVPSTWMWIHPRPGTHLRGHTRKHQEVTRSASRPSKPNQQGS